MIWLSVATAEASSLGLGHFNFVTVQRSDTTSQPALMEFMELSREWDSLYSFTPTYLVCPFQSDTYCTVMNTCVCMGELLDLEHNNLSFFLLFLMNMLWRYDLSYDWMNWSLKDNSVSGFPLWMEGSRIHRRRHRTCEWRSLFSLGSVSLEHFVLERKLENRVNTAGGLCRCENFQFFSYGCVRIACTMWFSEPYKTLK